MSIGSPEHGVFVSHTSSAKTLDLVKGSIASMPKGAVTTWHITRPFREWWVLSGE